MPSDAQSVPDVQRTAPATQRRRRSYKFYAKLIQLLRRREDRSTVEVLEFFFQHLDRRRVFRSRMNSEFNHESMLLAIQDAGLPTRPPAEDPNER